MDNTVGYLLARATRPVRRRTVARWMTGRHAQARGEGPGHGPPGARELLAEVAAAASRTRW